MKSQKLFYNSSQIQEKNWVFWTVVMLLLCSHLCSRNVSAVERSRRKPRVIATTDGEIDDRCSMIRFLLYANEWDIEGIIYSSSKFHWKGHKWAGEKWIEDDIDKYAQIYKNLKQHKPDFPTPQQLRDKIYVGNIDNVGEMDKDTPGSQRIVEVLLDSKPGPVYLQAWGGTNTVARALYKIQHKHPDQIKRVCRKAIIYIILDQDKTFREYIQPNWPDLMVLGSFRQFRTIAYKWDKIIPPAQKKYFDSEWMKKNILKEHGPLCSSYEAHDDGRFRSEGDSPAFMHQIMVGLRSLEHPSYGGWGGRFVKEKGTKNVWTGAQDDGSWSKPIWRWAEAFQNDWAARADWCVKSYKQANHPPLVALAHPTDLKAKSRDTVKLSAKGSKDPDGDKLTYRWWQYKEPSLFKGKINIQNANQQQAWFIVPQKAKKGQTVHIICEVTDNGNPPLARYKRVIVDFTQ
ncbi:MAG: nucleoside hydrolase-like domain-containing protein [Sedimentisphaerales bacterium]